MINCTCGRKVFDVYIGVDAVMSVCGVCLDASWVRPKFEHNTESDDCWCSPCIQRMDNGINVVIHREEN